MIEGGVHALILAAGQGRRFGGVKLHALYRGRPLLSYALDVVETARSRGLIDGGHVVVSASDDQSQSMCRNAGFDTIINHAPERGLSGSLRLGLTGLESWGGEKPGAALILLGDQPLVRLEVIEMLVARWRQGNAEVIRPRYEAHPEVPGHPALLARTVWPAVHQLQGDHGLGSSLLDPSQFATVTLNVPGDNPDVDTPADLLGLESYSR